MASDHAKNRQPLLRRIGGVCAAAIAAVGGFVIGEKIRSKLLGSHEKIALRILPEAISLASFAVTEELTREQNPIQGSASHLTNCVNRRPTAPDVGTRR